MSGKRKSLEKKVTKLEVNLCCPKSGGINKAQNAIDANKDLSREEKRRLLDDIQRKKNFIYCRVNMLMRLGEL